MSNAPLSDDELPAASDSLPEEEPSWLERLLARFGLGEEPDPVSYTHLTLPTILLV